MKIKSNGHKCSATIVGNDFVPPRRRKRKRTAPRQVMPQAVAGLSRRQIKADIDWFLNKPKVEVVGGGGWLGSQKPKR